MLLQGDTIETTSKFRASNTERSEWSTKIRKNSSGIKLSKVQVNDTFQYFLDALIKDYKDVSGEPKNLPYLDPVTTRSL